MTVTLWLALWSHPDLQQTPTLRWCCWLQTALQEWHLESSLTAVMFIGSLRLCPQAGPPRLCLKFTPRCVAPLHRSRRPLDWAPYVAAACTAHLHCLSCLLYLCIIELQMDVSYMEISEGKACQCMHLAYAGKRSINILIAWIYCTISFTDPPRCIISMLRTPYHKQ